MGSHSPGDCKHMFTTLQWLAQHSEQHISPTLFTWIYHLPVSPLEFQEMDNKLDLARLHCFYHEKSSHQCVTWCVRICFQTSLFWSSCCFPPLGKKPKHISTEMSTQSLNPHCYFHKHCSIAEIFTLERKIIIITTIKHTIFSGCMMQMHAGIALKIKKTHTFPSNLCFFIHFQGSST